MAAINASIHAKQVSTGTTLKTLLSLKAPTNQRLKLKEISIGFEGINNAAAPILVEVYRFGTDGTGAAQTPVADDSSVAETLQATGSKAYTVEPATTDAVIRTWAIHPQTGQTLIFGAGEEIVIPGSKFVGLRVTAGASINADAYFRFEE